ncbi:MAG: CrcB family protein [Pseudomonadota bacterium]
MSQTLPLITACALVASGGAIGSVARHLFMRAFLGWTGSDGFPWALLGINTLGSFLMGLLLGWFYLNGGGTEGQRLFFAAGVLGGFTTFSAFSLEVILLFEKGAYLHAGAFMAGSVLAGVAAITLGLIIMGPAK